MAQVVNRGVNIYIESGEAEKALERLTAKEKKLNEELAKTSDPKRIKALKTELDKLSEPIDRATKKVKGELAPSFRDLETATRKYLNEFKKTGDPAILAQYQKFNAELGKQKALITDLEKGNKELTSKGIFSGAFWGNLAAQGISLATNAISGFLRSSVDEALQANENAERLRSTLSNLGKTDAFERLTAAADRMAEKFTYLDNDDVVAVFNKLIDYGKLTENQMQQLTPVIIDFAAKTKQPITEATSVILKALEGNGKALKEFGINIKDAGTEGERFSVIMTDLKSKVDGAGESFMNTAAGGIATAEQEFKNLKEEIGTGLLPVLNAVLDFFVKAAKGARDFAVDSYNFITDMLAEAGMSGAGGMRKAIREIEKIDKINKQIGQELADKFVGQDKTTIQAEIDAVTKKLDDAKKFLTSVPRLKKEGIETSPEKIDEYTNKVAAYSEEIKQLNALLITDKLGTGGNKTGTAKAMKDTADEAARLAKELQDIADSLIPDGLQKDLAKVDTKYNELLKRAKKYNGDINQVEELYQRERNQVIDKYAKEAADKAAKLDAEQKKRILDIALKASGRLSSLLSTDSDYFDRDNRNRLAGAQLALSTASGRKKLDAEKALLEEQKQQELRAKDLTENEKLLIEEKYRQLRSKAEEDYFNKLVGEIAGYAQQALNIYSQFAQIRTNQENAELARDKRINDTKKDNLQRQLSANLITQKQYNAAIAKIDAEQEKRQREIQTRQFKRQQRADIAQAIINGALAVTSTLSAKPGALDIISLGAFRAIQIGLAVATTAAQIATIGSQKPAFARGGKLGGRSHSTGGNPILDGATGQQIAEIEAGEGIINKKTMADSNVYTFTGTPNQIASRMNAMHGGIDWASTGTITPAFRSYSAPMFNYGGMINSLQRKYAAGGTFGGGGAVNDDLVKTIKTLNAILAGGIPAYMLLTQNEIQQGRLYAIRKDAQL